MKGKFTLQVLEKLSEAASGAGDLIEAVLSSGYGASIGKLDYKMRVIKKRRRREAEERAVYVRLQKRYYNVLSWLRRDDLIVEKLSAKGKVFSLNRRGLQKLSALRERQVNYLPVASYDVVGSNNFAIAIFDIPEKERRKRAWLRAVLKNMGFAMLQKSVWAGKLKVPKSFIDDLSRLKIVEYVEILEVTKTGSIQQVI